VGLILAGRWLEARAKSRIESSRLYMDSETPALGARFREAEAVLIGDPANPAF